MIQAKTAIKPPSDDKRWRIVEATIRRNGAQGQALIEVLHSVQEVFGYLDDPSLVYVAKALRLPLSKVYGVATFYHFFSLKPQGKHTCVVCMGTACYIKGAPELLKEVEKHHHIKPGQTTADGELSVIQARCIGSCSMAPAVVFDGHVAGNLGVDEFNKRLDESLKAKTAAPAN